MIYAFCIYSLAPSNVKPLFADTSDCCGQPVAVMSHSTPNTMRRTENVIHDKKMDLFSEDKTERPSATS